MVISAKEVLSLTEGKKKVLNKEEQFSGLKVLSVRTAGLKTDRWFLSTWRVLLKYI